jgi:hypothetical protein
MFLLAEPNAERPSLFMSVITRWASDRVEFHCVVATDRESTSDQLASDLGDTHEHSILGETRLQRSEATPR